MAVADHFQRREAVAKARVLMHEQGLGQNEAAAAVGTSPATLCRWLGKYAAGGTVELAPKYKGRVGRKKLSAKATLEDRVALCRLKLKTKSDALALDLWADDPRCSPELRAAIQRPRASRHNLPDSLRQLCYVTPEIEAKLQGDRAYQLNGFVQQRDDTIVLADGTRRPIEPGDVWELDDMSGNQPFWWDDPEGESPLAKRQGAAVGRQILFCQDVRGRWLGHECVGRPRDAYRAEDILRFLRGLFAAHGMPRVGLRLESGIWRAKVIAGVTLDGAERPGMDEEERAKLFGGLQELGLTIDWCHSPNHKGGIESSFRYLQRVMAAQAICGDDYVVDLGSYRGEFERGTKALMAAHAGRKHPRDLGFWHIEDVCEKYRAACGWLNSARPKEGRIQHGVPDIAWEESVRREPLKSVPKDKLWIFLPHESECAIRGAHVCGQALGVKHWFCAPTLFADLGGGYPLRIRFDVTEPSLGAWIFNNARAGDACNVRGLPRGDYLGWAEFSEDAPQFDLQHGFDGRLRKRFDARVRANFAAIGLYGRRAAAAAEARDGRGGVAKIERGLTPAPGVVPPEENNRLSAPALGGSPSAHCAGNHREIPNQAPEQPARAGVVSPARAPKRAPDPDPADIDALEARLRERGALIG